MEDVTKEPIVKFYKKTDFEKRLFLEQEVKELKEQMKLLDNEKKEYKNKYKNLRKKIREKAENEVFKSMRTEFEKELAYDKKERTRLKMLILEQQVFKQQQNEIKRLNKLLNQNK